MTTNPQPNVSTGKVEHTSTDRFEQDVLKSNMPVLVDFYADWCMPCRRLAPVLDKVAQAMPNAKVVKVNIDNNQELASRYGVSSIPTVMVFKNGSVATQQTGLVDQQTLQTMLGG